MQQSSTSNIKEETME